jgi:hypothetical protein
MLLALDFPRIIFEHTFREANFVSHEFAKMARGSAQVWLNGPPIFVLHLLWDDVALISNE